MRAVVKRLETLLLDCVTVGIFLDSILCQAYRLSSAFQVGPFYNDQQFLNKLPVDHPVFGILFVGPH